VIGLCAKLIKKGFGVLQVGGVKSLGEPLVDRRQQVIGVLTLVLLPPQMDQACGGAEFPGFGLLISGYGERFVVPGFRLGQCPPPPPPASAAGRCSLMAMAAAPARSGGLP
jgi:hypothetical protein